MDGACSTYGRKRNPYDALVGSPKERDNLKNRGFDGMVIYNLVKKTEPDWVYV